MNATRKRASLSLSAPGWAEMCSEDQRNHMIKIFDLPVYREYGSSETSIIAIEDQEFQWNISTNRLHIEIVDENSIPVQSGQKGRILITDLYNRAMPLIRYEIGDVGSIEKLDKSPFMRLKTLDGRLSDVIHLPNGRKLPGLTFYYISRSLIENGTNIKRFIITQKKINEFVFDYVSDQELSQEIKQKIMLESKKYLNSDLDYTFNRVDTIPDKPSGKIQHFFSEVLNERENDGWTYIFIVSILSSEHPSDVVTIYFVVDDGETKCSKLLLKLLFHVNV